MIGALSAVKGGSMKDLRSVAGIFVLVFCMAFSANAKKTAILNVDKGETFNDYNGVEVSISEENAEKKGSMVVKLDVAKGGEGFWAGVSNPKKIFDGYDFIRFYAFNPGKTPLPLAITVKFGSSNCKYEDRFDANFMLKPGKNNVEVEIAAACTNGGKACDWKQKPFWYFSGPQNEKYTFYVGSIFIETAEDEKPAEKEKKK